MTGHSRRCHAAKRDGIMSTAGVTLLFFVSVLQPTFASIPLPSNGRVSWPELKRDGILAGPSSAAAAVPVFSRRRISPLLANLNFSGGGVNGHSPTVPLTPSSHMDTGISDEISRCLSSSSPGGHPIRGGSTEAAPLPEERDAAVDGGGVSDGDMSDGGKRKKSKEVELSTAAQYAKKLKNRNRTNIKRKILHCTFGLFFVGLHHVIPRNRFVPGMTILTSATLVMELLRYRRGFGWMNDALHFVLGNQLRKHEMEGKFTGSFYYFFGVTMTAYLFPKTAASLGIAQLAIADPSASFFGRHTRHIYWSRIEGGLGGIGRNKGILGFLGGALFCFPYNYRVLSLAKWGAGGIPGGKQSLVLASLLLGAAGAFADLAVPTPAVVMPSKICGIRVPPLHIDDNFVVPMFSGWACTKIFDLVGWPQGLELSDYILF